MARQPTDVNEPFENKNIFFADRADDVQRLQASAAEVAFEDEAGGTSGSSPRKKHRKKESSSSSETESETSVHSFSDAASRSSSLRPMTLNVLHVEREIDVLVRLRCSLKVDSNTRDCVGKVLTSVHCESTQKNSSSGDRRKNVDDSTTDPAIPRLPLGAAGGASDSSGVSAANSSPGDWINEEWKNLNLLTTAMMNFANAKLRDGESTECEENAEDARRPRERIHFSTPEVEEKYRKIVRRETDDSSDISAGSSRKRKYSSEIFAEPSESPWRSEAEIVETLGPIPPAGSNLFEGMSFVLTCVSRDFIDPHQLATMETTADVENEEQWTRRPFVRKRLIAQLEAGGGEVYESFDSLPPEKYETTRLITNIPNLSAKSLLCLSVGIKTYNHQWIIRCCQENKIVNPAEEQLPAGWSLITQSYVETFQRPSQKPFLSNLPVVIVIPMHPAKRQFVSLWEKICENAGATVILVKNPADGFMEGTVVLMHSLCPSWLIKKAKSWGIPLVSTRWAIQCLIEGQICSYDAHPSFDYDYAKLA